MQSNVIEEQSTKLCCRNNKTLFILRYVHKLFSYIIFCNSYLDLASSNKCKELITKKELITEMDQHQTKQCCV